MDIKVQEFIDEVTLKFAFLEEYGYHKIAGRVENADYFPDSEVVVKYVGKSIGVEIYWYFAGANIGVVFVELKNGELPTKKVFWSEINDASRAINLYSLAGLLNKLDDKSFLLKEVDNVYVSKIKKREELIRENMTGVIDGLSAAVRKFASSIIKGDTSVFKEVMDYQSLLVKKED